MKTLDMHRVVSQTEHVPLRRARGWRGRRGLEVALLASAVAGTLSGCIVTPGYVAPAPAYYAPAPFVVAPAPVFVFGGYRGRRW